MGSTRPTTGPPAVGAALTLLLFTAASPAHSQVWEEAPASVNPLSAGANDLDGDGTLSVLVLYDDSGPFSQLGPIYAEMLLNLLGHFPQVEAWSIPISEYAAGDLLSEEVTFYLGSTYEQPLPAAFTSDFWVTDRPLIWIGYNLWQIGWTDWNAFLLEYGFQHWFVAGNTGSGETTDFYRYVDYKGQELNKFAWWNPDAQAFINDPFVNILYLDPLAPPEVLATITHSGTSDVQPYVVRSGNLTHVTDIPFTFIHEQDRYLAFGDLLHDFIGIDHPQTQTALFRLEDVHPKVAPADIRSVTDVMKEGTARPWHIALIPQYEDPLGTYNGGVPESVSMNAGASRAWRRQVNRARNNGADLVLHGYTHQYSNVPNPYNGVSGDDFEFWDAVGDGPIPGDSYSWFASRINSAEALMQVQGWTADAFESPHYRASVLDYLATSDFYDTTWHRVVYYPYEVDVWGQLLDWNDVYNDPNAVPDWSAATVNVAGDMWGGQFFPYVIHRDVYGQKVIPETMGNIEPAEFALGPQYVRLVPDLLANAEANLVNRCGFAAFFFHAYLMQFPDIPDAGGKQALRDLVQGVEALGYSFAPIDSL